MSVNITQYPDGWTARRPDGSYYAWFPNLPWAMLRGGPYPKRTRTLLLNSATGMVDRFVRGY